MALILLALFRTRAEFLVLALPLGFLLGEIPALVINPLAERAHRFASRLRAKLDRPRCGPLTLIYRGMAALAMLLVPALIVGAALALPMAPARGAAFVFLVALFGRSFATFACFRFARRGAPPLELGDHLFADSHGRIRHAILAQGEAFAVGVVGAAVWFLIAGPIGLLISLTLRLAALHFGAGLFGWAPRSLFALADALPRLLACAAMDMAGLVVPRCHPIRALGQGKFHGFLADLLGLSLGGAETGPAGPRSLAWLGRGTPKAERSDFVRFLLLRTAGGLILLLALAIPLETLLFAR